MSHELRTPLNGILGFTDLMKSGHFGAINETQSDFLSQIESRETFAGTYFWFIRCG
ncbi:MAG: hypothetical protein CM1200mP16_06030 [Nitrospina sp.]|nr:MAG: hypothetical protein CM1200mP16_06030 [Nitrospina sp.]